jgi:2-dehydro-3-deoxygalactonokinase
MRGEETQIAGILSAEPGFEGVLCLPGTHTKWVRVSGGEIVHFKTFMTGELFNLLAVHSVLRHSVDAGGWDKAAFAGSVKSVIAEPGGFAGQLFAIRAETLVASLDPATARARLSGTLVGAELAAARDYWQGQTVAIVGNGPQAETYGEGLLLLGQSPRMLDATPITLAGLKSAYEQIAKDFG